MDALTWRPLRRGDVAALARIAADRFPDHFEETRRFEERLRLSPAWCFGLVDGREVLNGYLVAYPWVRGAVPPLNAPLGRLPEGTGTLFLHDLALSPAATGRGFAGAILERLSVKGREAGFEHIALVTVNDTERFWRRHGFEAVLDPGLASTLQSHGPGARYMVRSLTGR